MNNSNVEIHIRPLDNRNPSCGYQLTVINSATLHYWLNTSSHPATGETLDVHSAMEVAATYIKPKGEG